MVVKVYDDMTKTTVVVADGVDRLVNQLGGYKFLLFTRNHIVPFMVIVDVRPERY